MKTLAQAIEQVRRGDNALARAMQLDGVPYDDPCVAGIKRDIMAALPLRAERDFTLPELIDAIYPWRAERYVFRDGASRGGIMSRTLDLEARLRAVAEQADAEWRSEHERADRDGAPYAPEPGQADELRGAVFAAVRDALLDLLLDVTAHVPAATATGIMASTAIDTMLDAAAASWTEEVAP